ncbi:MAG TPA: holo-ACP synthase, partial [Marmoricola sp.]|nr:holo-ACP synthase [Marmoricola sp.]
SNGQPHFVLSGSVAARASELGVRRTHLSISHDAGVAVAMVVLES